MLLLLHQLCRVSINNQFKIEPQKLKLNNNHLSGPSSILNQPKKEKHIELLYLVMHIPSQSTGLASIIEIHRKTINRFYRAVQHKSIQSMKITFLDTWTVVNMKYHTISESSRICWLLMTCLVETEVPNQIDCKLTDWGYAALIAPIVTAVERKDPKIFGFESFTISHFNILTVINEERLDTKNGHHLSFIQTNKQFKLLAQKQKLHLLNYNDNNNNDTDRRRRTHQGRVGAGEA